MDVIQKAVRRYSLVDAGHLCRLFRSDDVFRESGDDWGEISNLAGFTENHLRSPLSWLAGFDPRHECFIYVPMHTTTTYAGHFIVRKDKRGRDAVIHAAQSAKLLFEHTKCYAIMGFIRERNRRACMFASHVGLRRIGTTSGTVLYNGEYENEAIYQCTLEDYNDKYGDLLGRV